MDGGVLVATEGRTVSAGLPTVGWSGSGVMVFRTILFWPVEQAKSIINARAWVREMDLRFILFISSISDGQGK